MKIQGRKKKEKRINRLLLLKDILITLVTLKCTTAICWNLRNTEYGETQIALLYVLAVLLIARFSSRFYFGLIASLLAMLQIDYFFMEPYFQLDFSLNGYPFTFFVIFAVSNVVSMLMLQIRQQEKNRLEAEREKLRANLLRAISHDIRTPLTSIIGSVSTVIENYSKMEKEDSVSLLMDARAEAQWLVRVVENLLLVTKVDGVGISLRKTPELADEVLSSAVLKLKKRFPDAPIEAGVSEELLFIPMGAVLVEQVICNLVENAIVHGGQVSRIGIFVRREKDKALFLVEDDGKGIEPEVQRKLLKQGLYNGLGEEQTGKRNLEIGLPVCKSIIEAHKGELLLSNRAEGGTSVKFWLPLEEEGKEA